MKGEKFAKTLLLLGCPQIQTTAYNIDTKRLRIRPYITRSNGKKEGKKRGKSTISQILRDFRNLTCVIGFSRSETQIHKHKQGFQYWSDDVEVTTSDRHRVLPMYPTLQMKDRGFKGLLFPYRDFLPPQGSHRTCCNIEEMGLAHALLYHPNRLHKEKVGRQQRTDRHQE
jgi:hypothetical protein